MLRKIESLRKKPKEVRNRYAFWVAFSVTLIIIVFWAISVPSRFADESVYSSDAGDSSFFKSLEEIGSLVSEKVATIKEQTAALEDAFSTTTTESASSTDPIELVASSTAAKNWEITNTSGENTGRTILIGTTSQATTADIQ